jgi:ABC-2 type transport system ATP-binding protein
LNETLDELFDLLDMYKLLKKPVRTLSLGERMKCELIAALLYRPRILFLDEPTLGLDISMQRRVRQFIAEYNKRHSATILLTSHYIADVEVLCPRVLLIHHGQLLYDGSLRALASKLAPNKFLRILLSEDATASFSTSTLPPNVSVVDHEQSAWTLSVPPLEITSLTAYLLSTLPIVDLAIEDAPVETVIDAVYQGGAI